jgi:hypothetical protein
VWFVLKKSFLLIKMFVLESGVLAAYAYLFISTPHMQIVDGAKICWEGGIINIFINGS